MVALEHFKDVEFYHIEVGPPRLLPLRWQRAPPPPLTSHRSICSAQGEATRPALENYVARMFDMDEFNDKKAYYNIDQVIYGWKQARGDL